MPIGNESEGALVVFFSVGDPTGISELEMYAPFSRGQKHNFPTCHLDRF